MFFIKTPMHVLSERIAMRVQMSTIYASYRPFGSSIIMGGFNELGNQGQGDFQLYMVEPSGTCYQYYGCASGRGKQICRNEIEKTKF